MDGLNAESGPERDDAGKKSASSLDDALSAALAEWPDESNRDDRKSDASGSWDDSQEPDAENKKAEPAGQAAADAQHKEPAQAGIPEAPQHWSQADRSVFDRLKDPEARKLLLERDRAWQKGFTHKTQEMAEERRLAESIRNQITDAERSELQQRGMTEADLFKSYRQLDALYRQNPLQYVQLVMQQAGLTPEHFQSQPGDPQYQEEWEDPEIKSLKSEIFELKQQLGVTRQEWSQYGQSQRQAHSENAIRQFMSATGEGGQPRYPHFDEAQEQMAWVMQNHMDVAQLPPSVEKLERAYERVMQIDPNFRQLQEQRIREEAERKAHAERVRNASTAKPKPGSAVQSSQRPSSLDDIIRQSMQSAGI